MSVSWSRILTVTPTSWQFVKFLFVGLLNVAINAVVFAGLIYLGCHYIIASGVGAVLGIANGFLWNRYYVFQSGTIRRQILGTAAVYSVQIAVSWACLILLIEVFNLSVFVSYWINVVVVTIVSFVGLKYFAFKSSAPVAGTEQCR